MVSLNNLDKDYKDRCRRGMHIFMKCNRLHRALVESSVKELELHRSQHSMLLAINFADNISQKELSKKMEISPAAVTVTLKRLEAQGYIQRQQREDDTRMNSIYVTDKGREIIERTGEIFDAADQRAFKDFSVKELDQFIGYLQRISYNLKSVGSYLNREE